MLSPSTVGLLADRAVALRSSQAGKALSLSADHDVTRAIMALEDDLGPTHLGRFGSDQGGG